MTRRDTYIVAAVAVIGAVAAFWFLALSPKREQLSVLDKDVAEARQVLDQAKQEKVKFARDQVAFPRLYASLGRLGKAVPPDEDVPSLLVQLNHAANKAGVNFHSVELKLALAEKTEQSGAAAAAAPAPAGESGAAASASGGEGAASASAGAEGSPAPPAGGEGAAQPAGAAAPAGGEAAPASGAAASASAGSAAPATGAPADGAAAPATAGQFKALPFEYKFKGTFFDLEDLIHNVTRLVERRNQELAVTGRLITIQGFTLKRGNIVVLATTYMLPADQGLFAGATPQGPAGTDPAAPQAAAAGSASPTPPTAAVTSP